MQTPSNNKRLIIVGIVLLLLVGFGSYFLGAKSQATKQTSLIEETTPTSIPVQFVTNIPSKVNQNPSLPPTSMPTWKIFQGKSSYSQDKSEGKFEISYPDYCKTTSPTSENNLAKTIIKCDFNNSSFTINPQAGGHGAEVIKSDEITLKDKNWRRTLVKHQIHPGALVIHMKNQITRIIN